MTSKRVRANTVVNQIIEEIRQLIASGKYEVNDKLPSEAELAKMFGVGLSSIREAIKVFNHLGILESRPAKGTFVSDRTQISKEALTWSILLGKDDMCEMIDFRKAIEMECVLTMQARVRSDDAEAVNMLRALENHLDTMAEALAKEDERIYMRADFDFHEAIVYGRGNALLSSIFDTLRAFVRMEMKETRQFGRRYADVHREHQEIVRAIRDGSADDLVRVIEDHFNSIKNVMNAYLKAKR